MNTLSNSESSHLGFTNHRSYNILDRLIVTDKIISRYFIYLIVCATLRAYFFTVNPLEFFLLVLT